MAPLGPYWGSRFKWYETAGYMMRPRFGDVTHLILMNLGAWNSLSSAQQLR